MINDLNGELLAFPYEFRNRTMKDFIENNNLFDFDKTRGESPLIFFISA